MNRFRRKKEVKDASEGPIRPSTDSEAPLLPPMKRTFRRGKKPSERDTKPQIDLSTALPSSDDFRTSLLMNGLSARFSVLRELEDSKTKIGTTSDSLIPNSQTSKNNYDFLSLDLSDISEFPSASRSLRPPQDIKRARSASSLRTDGIDDESLPRSIMDRARPGEGNNLFGGRQKVNVGNRVLYDADVRLSSFQKQRRQERDWLKQIREETKSSEPLPPSSHSNSNSTSDTSSSTSDDFESSSKTSSLSDVTRNPSMRLPQSQSNLKRVTSKALGKYDVGLNSSSHEETSTTIRIDTRAPQRTLVINASSPAASPITIPSQGDWVGSKKQISRTDKLHSGGSTIAHDPVEVNSKKYGIDPPLSPPVSENDESPAFLPRPEKHPALALTPSLSPKPYETSNEAPDANTTKMQNPHIEGISQSHHLSTLTSSSSSKQSTSHSRTGSESSYGSARSKMSTSPSAPDDSKSDWDFMSSLDYFNTTNPSSQHFDLPQFCSSPKIKPPPISQHPMNSDQSLDVYPDGPSKSLAIPADQAKSSAASTAPSDITRMVRWHMQNPSNDSSIDGVSTSASHNNQASSSGTTSPNKYLTNSNPWGVDSAVNRDLRNNALGLKISVPLSHSSPSMPFQNTQLNPAPKQKINNIKSEWDEDLESRHVRQESTDTQQEKQNLRNELASRRRHVQEKMKSFVEADSRSTSPLPEASKEGPSKNSTFGVILRTKPSRSSIKPKDVQHKPVKVSGRGNMATINAEHYAQPAREGKEEGHDGNFGFNKESSPPRTKSTTTQSRDRQIQPVTKAGQLLSKSNEFIRSEARDKNQIYPPQQNRSSPSTKRSTSGQSIEKTIAYLQPHDGRNVNWKSSLEKLLESSPMAQRDNSQSSTYRPSANLTDSLYGKNLSKIHVQPSSNTYKIEQNGNRLTQEYVGTKTFTLFPGSRTPISDQINSSIQVESRPSNQSYPMCSRYASNNNLRNNRTSEQIPTPSASANPNLHVANFLRKM